MALKDSAGLVKCYAMLNIEKYQTVAIGDTVSECENSYKQMMSQSGIVVTQPNEIKRVTGVITQIVPVVIDGNSHYYITLDNQSVIYDVNVKDNPKIITYAIGVPVTLNYSEEPNSNRLLSAGLE